MTLQQRLEEQGWRRPGLDEYEPAAGRTLIPPLTRCEVAFGDAWDVAQRPGKTGLTPWELAPVYVVFDASGEFVERVEYLVEETSR